MCFYLHVYHKFMCHEIPKMISKDKMFLNTIIPGY